MWQDLAAFLQDFLGPIISSMILQARFYLILNFNYKIKTASNQKNILKKKSCPFRYENIN
jgi:hypothetical protein